MDYKRIYSEFIKDRREKENTLTGYTERHHIWPKCMGGSDDAENLIRLTPEDHYFAHLLLAHVYGGRNWAAVVAMCQLANDIGKLRRKKLNARSQFGHVRRKLARYYRSILSGENGRIADRRKYELRSFDGTVVTGNRFELSAHTGVPRQQISALLRGAKLSAHGWYSPIHNKNGTTKAERLSAAIRDNKVHTLYHHDGRVWSGSQWEFRRAFGQQLLFQHDNGCVLGWYRTKGDAESHGVLRKQTLQKALKARGSISGRNNPNLDETLYRLRVVETGEVLEATKFDIRERFGIKSANLCAIFSGRQKQTGGIALA